VFEIVFRFDPGWLRSKARSASTSPDSSGPRVAEPTARQSCWVVDRCRSQHPQRIQLLGLQTWAAI